MQGRAGQGKGRAGQGQPRFLPSSFVAGYPPMRTTGWSPVVRRAWVGCLDGCTAYLVPHLSFPRTPPSRVWNVQVKTKVPDRYQTSRGGGRLPKPPSRRTRQSQSWIGPVSTACSRRRPTHHTPLSPLSLFCTKCTSICTPTHLHVSARLSLPPWVTSLRSERGGLV